MPSSDLQTTADIRAAMSDGATAVDICTAYLERIATRDGPIHAFTHVAGERALADAAEIDADGRGRDDGADEDDAGGAVPSWKKVGGCSTGAAFPTNSSAPNHRRCSRNRP